MPLPLWDSYHVAQFRIPGGLHNLSRFGVIYRTGGIPTDSGSIPQSYAEVDEALRTLKRSVLSTQVDLDLALERSAESVDETSDETKIAGYIAIIRDLQTAMTTMLATMNDAEAAVGCMEVAEVNVLKKTRRPCPYDER